MVKNKKIVLVLLSLCAAAAIGVLAYNLTETEHLMETDYETAIVRIGNSEIKAEIADSEEKMTLGLSGREKLGENEGMLFVFKEKGRYTFWMKDMNFPLDFIWIAGNTVVGIDESITNPGEGEEPEKVTPSQNIDKVLEVNAGWIEDNFPNKSDIIGARVEIIR